VRARESEGVCVHMYMSLHVYCVCGSISVYPLICCYGDASFMTVALDKMEKKFAICHPTYSQETTFQAVDILVCEVPYKS
jgi:hypothetical protein